MFTNGGLHFQTALDMCQCAYRNYRHKSSCRRPYTREPQKVPAITTAAATARERNNNRVVARGTSHSLTQSSRLVEGREKQQQQQSKSLIKNKDWDGGGMLIYQKQIFTNKSASSAFESKLHFCHNLKNQLQ